jgi:DMSO/TMAO reductase YedYZ molybdopterin-dependent catalytic subunit
MKSQKNIFIISLLIILSLSLLVGCKAKTPPTIGESRESPQAKLPEEQPKELPSDPPKENPQDTPVEAPAEIKPEELQKSTEATPESSQEPAKDKDNDKIVLKIEGSAIVKPITLGLDELKDMKDYYIEDDFFSLNSYGTKEYFHFKGVKIKAVLDKVGVNKDNVTISFIASDGYKQELTLGEALREDYIDEQNPDKKYPIIIAWHENGKDYDAKKGPPFRLVIGQKEPGDVNKPQWVQNVSKIIID